MPVCGRLSLYLYADLPVEDKVTSGKRMTSRLHSSFSYLVQNRYDVEIMNGRDG